MVGIHLHNKSLPLFRQELLWTTRQAARVSLFPLRNRFAADFVDQVNWLQCLLALTSGAHIQKPVTMHVDN